MGEKQANSLPLSQPQQTLAQTPERWTNKHHMSTHNTTPSIFSSESKKRGDPIQSSFQEYD